MFDLVPEVGKAGNQVLPRSPESIDHLRGCESWQDNAAYIKLEFGVQWTPTKQTVCLVLHILSPSSLLFFPLSVSLSGL